MSFPQNPLGWNVQPTSFVMNENNYGSNEFALKPGDAFVAICDWNGVVKWTSNHTVKTQIGDLCWANMIHQDAEKFKCAFAKTASLQQPAQVEIETLDGARYRIWMWSIGNPGLAVCTFNLLIPSDIKLLTDKERELMKHLATGAPFKQIATELDVSVNTLHTHSRNIKSKLRLGGPGEVTAYAAKFFHHSDQHVNNSCIS